MTGGIGCGLWGCGDRFASFWGATTLLVVVNVSAIRVRMPAVSACAPSVIVARGGTRYMVVLGGWGASRGGGRGEKGCGCGVGKGGGGQRMGGCMAGGQLWAWYWCCG